MDDDQKKELIKDAKKSARPNKEHILALFVNKRVGSFRVQLFYGNTPPQLPIISEKITVQNERGLSAQGIVTKITTDVSFQGDEPYIIYIVDIDAS